MAGTQRRGRSRALTALLTWNLLMLVGAVFWSLWVQWIASMGGPSCITALDRAGIIDETKLREVHPELAGNLRNELGRWVARRERTAAIDGATAGIVSATINLILLVLLRRANRQCNTPPPAG